MEHQHTGISSDGSITGTPTTPQQSVVNVQIAYPVYTPDRVRNGFNWGMVNAEMMKTLDAQLVGITERIQRETAERHLSTMQNEIKQATSLRIQLRLQESKLKRVIETAQEKINTRDRSLKEKERLLIEKENELTTKEREVEEKERELEEKEATLQRQVNHIQKSVHTFSSDLKGVQQP